MNLITKIKNIFYSKNGNIALAGLVTFLGILIAGFLFDTIDTLAVISQHRIAHLTNAERAGMAFQAVAIGETEGKDMLAGSATAQELYDHLQIQFKDENFNNEGGATKKNGTATISVTIKALTDYGILVGTGNDPSQDTYGTKRPYSLASSNVVVRFLKQDNNEVTSHTDKVHHLRIFVNLGGEAYSTTATQGIVGKAHSFVAGKPFYYVIMVKQSISGATKYLDGDDDSAAYAPNIVPTTLSKGIFDEIHYSGVNMPTAVTDYL
jgi:hypothetical protein